MWKKLHAAIHSQLSWTGTLDNLLSHQCAGARDLRIDQTHLIIRAVDMALHFQYVKILAPIDRISQGRKQLKCIVHTHIHISTRMKNQQRLRLFNGIRGTGMGLLGVDESAEKQQSYEN